MRLGIYTAGLKATRLAASIARIVETHAKQQLIHANRLGIPRASRNNTQQAVNLDS